MKIDKYLWHYCQLIIALEPHQSKLSIPLFDKKIQEAILYAFQHKPLELKSLYAAIRNQTYPKQFVLDLIQAIESQAIYQSKSEGERLLELSMISFNTNNQQDYFFSQLEEFNNDKSQSYPILYKIETFIQEVKGKQSFISGDIDAYLPANSLVHQFVFSCLEELGAAASLTQNRNRQNKNLLQYYEKTRTIQLLFEIQTAEIKLLDNLVRLHLEQTSTIFDELIELFAASKFNITSANLRNCYLGAINILYLKHTEWGRKQEDILNLYKMMKNHTGQDFYAYLNIQTIKNIATLCIRFKDKTWFDEVFSTRYTNHLSPEIKTTLRFCEAKFAFAQHDYQKSLDILITYKPLNIFQELDLRRLQVMCFYELKERVLVDNYLNSFKVFVHRNQEIVNRTKESNNNFIRILNRLNISIHIEKIEKLKSEINENIHVAEKQWLLTKIEELLIKLDNENR